MGEVTDDRDLREELAIAIQDAFERCIDYDTERDLCDAAMPIITAAIARARAEAWDEGFDAGDRNPGMQGGPNPYRAEPDCYSDHEIQEDGSVICFADGPCADDQRDDVPPTPAGHEFIPGPALTLRCRQRVVDSEYKQTRYCHELAEHKVHRPAAPGPGGPQ